MLKKVRIHIETERFGIEASLFDDIMNGETDAMLEREIRDENPMMEEPEKIEMYCDGRLRLTDDTFSLSYEEGALTGMEGSETQLSFMRSQPGLLTMLRSGSVSTALVFEQGKRHLCSYNTPYMPFELCVHTLRVRNELLQKGKLSLEYLIEIRGAQAEKCRLSLDVRDEAGVPLKEGHGR